MAANNKSYDVIIAGAGPVGLTMAMYMSKFGHKVAVFERYDKVFPYPRAGVLDDETARIWQTLGRLDELWENDHMYEGDIEFIDADFNRLCSFNRRALGDDVMAGQNGHYKLPFFHQPNTELLFRKAITEDPNIDFYVKYNVLSVENKGTEATLIAENIDSGEKSEYSAKFVIGCDGANSLVQKKMGVKMTDFEYSEDYLVVDCVVLDDVYFRTRFPDGCYIVIDPIRAGVIGKSLHNMVRFDFRRGSNSIINEDFNSKEELRQGARDYMVDRGFDPEKMDIMRADPYTFHAKTPENWRSGRLIVAGDAAHLTPPWVGQGLNMGIRDAANLSFKLDMVLRGIAKDSILDTYTEERRTVSLETIQASIKTGRIMEKNGVIINAIRKSLIRLAGKSKRLGTLLFKDWQKKPPYDSGMFGNNHKLAGTLMIQPKVADILGNELLLDDMVGLRFALLSTDMKTGRDMYRFVDEIGGAFLKVGKDFRDPHNHFTNWCKKHKIECVLIRPDRYIYDAGYDANALCASLMKKFDSYQNTLSSAKETKRKAIKA